ncbi:hypothetical protein GSI_13744 [Ganoderma sinense ZZ0214-1]|uniref:Chromo domain-containing protein n=1 Tax=Ganoderma sinense ZZ0214-1 TaxID=1077348 RepID=A0A2G8RR67_9APHY|nr:hypothetical protein GSI_13744 [Ganoderma sinense ZZ0214-1]
MSDDEYEVESILAAKVEGGKRGKKKSWSYWVKWKNYGPADNTWEPDTSFKGGSEHFIEFFWNRVDTQGRDIKHLEDFKPGEEFLPSGPPGKKGKKAKERKETPPAPIEVSDSEPEAPPPPVASGKKKGKKAQEQQDSPLPVVQPADSENEVGSLVNDGVEEPVASASTRSKRRRSSVTEEHGPVRPKGKQGRPPGKRPHELEAELAGLQLEPVILDEHSSPAPKRKRGRPPGIPANEMGSKSRLQSEPVVDEPAPPVPKRKRARPPGIPSHELEEQPVVDEPAPSTKRKRGGPPGIPSREMEKRAQPDSEPVTDEPSSPPPKRKRSGPPGISSREIDKQAENAAGTENEVAFVATSSTTKAASRRDASPKKRRNGTRVVPDSRAESPRGRKPVADEPTTSAPRRLSLPRRRRLAKAAPPQKSPSADELLIVPDSDEEKGRRKTQRSKKQGASAEDAMDVDALLEPSSTFGVPTLLSPDPAPEPSAEASPVPAIPAHRLRAANPRIKVADDPHLTDVNGPNAIEVKSRFMKRANGAGQASGSGRRAVVSGSKAGPGRSSATLFPENNTTRLMVQKGVLTSVKPPKISKAASEEAASAAAPDGDGSMEIDRPIFDPGDVPDLGPSGQLDVESEPEVPPTGQQLLDAAGMDDKAAEDLPDFEEDAEGELEVQSAPDAEVEVMEVEPPRAFGSISAASGQTVDAPSIQAKPLTFASRVGIWSQSTIFGPLALGLQGRSQSDNGTTDASSAVKRYAFHLNLDSAVSIPITLKDVHASHTFLDGLDATARNPTGKFYKDQHAIALVETLKAKASYARVTPGETATEDHKKHFERFISRLQNDELFIQMNRAETLVMCVSDNAVLGEKLGFPPQLLGLGSTAVVAHVDVEDFSQYAEAAVHADTTRW